MKILKYNLCTGVHRIYVDPVTEKETELVEEILSPVTMGWNEANEEIAKAEAYNGQYTIEDDGRPEPTPVNPTPTTDYATYEELAEAFSQGVDSI